MGRTNWLTVPLTMVPTGAQREGSPPRRAGQTLCPGLQNRGQRQEPSHQHRVHEKSLEPELGWAWSRAGRLQVGSTEGQGAPTSSIWCQHGWSF